MSHFRKCGFEKWDSMISLMWDSTLVSQKCVMMVCGSNMVIDRVLVLLCNIKSQIAERFV